MIKVLVTGGTGAVGQEAVSHLVRQGYTVRVVGRRENVEIEGAEYRSCDVTDFACVRDLMRGMDAVVHLAAVPNPSLASDDEIFYINCSGTYNVFEAAAQEGIKRVVQASSINALGYFYGHKAFDIAYFPIDEAHPTVTTDPYSFSKQIVEEIAAYYWRREGISSVSLRLPGVYDVRRRPGFREHRQRSVQLVREFVELPEDEWRQRYQALLARDAEMRAERYWEQPWESHAERFRDPDVALLVGRNNFWASLDARDSAQAIEKGLLVDYEGSHPLFVNNSDNWTGIPSRELIRSFFPEVETLKQPLEGTESLVSIDRARELLGFEPEYGLRIEAESDA